MKRKKYTVYCPVCGKELMKSVLTESDIRCPKCNTKFIIEVSAGKVSLVEELETKVAEEPLEYSN